MSPDIPDLADRLPHRVLFFWRSAVAGVTAWATLELACTGHGVVHAVIDQALIALPLTALGLAALALHRRRARDRR